MKQVSFTGHEEHMGQLRNSGEVWTASPHMLSTTCKAPLPTAAERGITYKLFFMEIGWFVA